MPARGRVQHFVSPKAQHPVPNRGGIGRDLLIQLSLDPAIVEIGHIDRIAWGELVVEVDAVTIRRDDGERYVIDCVGLRGAHDIEEEHLRWKVAEMAGFERLRIERSEIMVEPAFSNSRAVWAYRDCAIDARMHFSIVHLLHEEGPLRFHEVCQRVSGPRDPVATILAMACGNLVEIDLCKPLDHDTLVRLRP